METFSTIFIAESSNPVVKIEPLADFEQQNIHSHTESTSRRAKVGEIYSGSDAGDELLFVCSVCFAEFHGLAGFSVHVQVHLINIFSCNIESETKNILIDDEECADNIEHINEAERNVDDPIEAKVECDGVLDADGEVDVVVSQAIPTTKYKCSQCDRYLRTRSAVINHEKIHTQLNSQVFECFQCHLQFDTQYKCKAHMQLHRELPYECEHCFIRFRSNKHHRALCGPWNRYRCQSCPLKFHNKSALSRHVGMIHDKSLSYLEYIPNIRKLSERQYTCRRCPFKTWIRTQIKAHVDQCDEVKVQCHICKKLVVKRILNDHLSLHQVAIDRVVDVNEPTNDAVAIDPAETLNEQAKIDNQAEKNSGDGESDWSGHWSDANTSEQPPALELVESETKKKKTVRKYKCAYCNKHVSSLILMATHERSHFKNQIMPRSFECFICHAAAENRYRCQEHMRIHSDYPFKCQYCDISYNGNKFRMHQKLCGPWNDQACPSCPMKFHSAFALTRHRKVHRQRLYTLLIPNPENPSDRQFLCKSCPFVTSTQKKIHAHFPVCIASERPCKVCGKLVKLQAMKMHLVSHSDERNQLCLQCGKRFVHEHQLKTHMRSHSEERNFKCDVCQKPYKSMNEVAMHRRRHFNKLSHICKTCSRSYNSNYLLKVHLKSAHGLEVDAKDAVAMAQYGYTKKCIDGKIIPNS